MSQLRYGLELVQDLFRFRLYISGSSHRDTHGRGLNERGRQSGRAEQQNSKHLKILRDSSTRMGSANAAFALVSNTTTPVLEAIKVDQCNIIRVL